MKLVCQIIILILWVTRLFSGLYRDVNDRPAKMALGFKGVVSTILAVVSTILASGLIMVLYYFAGLFDKIF